MDSSLKNYLKFAKTEAQKRNIKAVIEYGSQRKAAKALGVSKGTISSSISKVKKYAALQGFLPDSDFVHPVEEPFFVDAVSTAYGENGEIKIQWVKSKLDKNRQLSTLIDSISSRFEDYKGKFKPTLNVTIDVDDDLLAVYPMGDPHIGMYSYAAETGDDFDVAIASENILTATSSLIDRTPAAKTAIILNLGDYFHTDNSDNRTARSNNSLDVDTRWSRVLSIGVEVMIHCVEMALNKHDTVVVKNIIGNHDDHSSLVLSIALNKFFYANDRVKVDVSPSKFWYYKFGQVLIGSTHGDMAKPVNLPGIMAADQSKNWGLTKYRYLYTGHIHNKQTMEFPGVMWESFRTLAAKDAWHSGMGYRAGRDMMSIVHHKDFGEVGRNIINIDMINKLIDESK